MMFCESRPFQNADDPSVHRVFRGKQHVHLMGDDESELINFARSIGMKEAWLQRDRWGLPHFDCTGRFMEVVMAASNVEKLDRRKFVYRYHEMRKMRAMEGK